MSAKHYDVRGNGRPANEKGTEKMGIDDEDRWPLMFEEAQKYIRSGPLFRTVTSIYAEKKLLVAFMAHLSCTMIIWVHFALIKFQEQENAVPLGANRYWWKRLIPPGEFGSMHSILFQMALLPLTMSRLSLSVLSSTVLDKFVPFNRMVRVHIHLGYTMISIVFCATCVFFVFFGLLCADGEDQFCQKFTSEIMATGYGIVSALMLVGVTSFLRDLIPYEVFYGIHHLVFIMYALATAHTMDDVQRNEERERSQNFKWYSATLLFYFCDRAAMYMNHRYETSIIASTAVTNSMGKHMAIIKVRRPPLFKFKAGQYASLRIQGIDQYWHPFSIASGPESDYLDFYIEIRGKDSWTDKLWNVLDKSKDHRTMFSRGRNDHIRVEVKGPYGTPIGKIEDFSHAIAIGGGTGVVPILSLLKQHARHLLRLDPDAYFKEQMRHNSKVQELHFLHEKNRGSILSWFCSKRRPHADHDQITPWDSMRKSVNDLRTVDCERRRLLTLKDLERESRRARIPIYGTVFMLLLPVFGVTMIGLMLSWNTVPIEPYTGMDVVLKAGTVTFQALFLVVALAVHDRSEFLTTIDFVMAVISGFTTWFWFAKDLWLNFSGDDIVYYCLMTFYMTARLWSSAVDASHKSWRSDVGECSSAMNKLQFIWVTRHAHLVSQIMPDLIDIWDALCVAWGEASARKACEISVYVTDRDDHACSTLTAEVSDSRLYQSGALKFARPDLQGIIRAQALNRINEEGSPHTSTLLAFCGSPKLASFIHYAKIERDIACHITGNTCHHMEFVSQSYGTSKEDNKNHLSQTSSEESDPTDHRHCKVYASTHEEGDSGFQTIVPSFSEEARSITRWRAISRSDESVEVHILDKQP